ncbi:hypothetical protein NB717_002354 [Xanthomonas sacchari]|nr:hypothetical protein [Xanthomonas sacchari]MCW0461286.1 hypothetical protein [Xanthomonas sacchari]
MPITSEISTILASRRREDSSALASLTNCRSILSLVTGSVLSMASDEKPVPKSSSAQPMPNALSSCILARTPAVSTYSADSVSSNSSDAGATPSLVITCFTDATKLGSSNCTGLTFTAITSARRSCSCDQRRSVLQA